MLPRPTSSSDSFFKGHRPYQLTIVILVVCFGYYVLQTQNKGNITESHSTRVFYPGTPGGPMHTVTSSSISGSAQCPPCACHCHCGKGAAATSGTTETITTDASESSSPSADPSKALVISSTQVYTSRPAIVNDQYTQFVRAIYPPVGPEKGSIHDASYLNTPIAYGTPLVPAKENDGFPTGYVSRPACQKDSDLLQNYIYKNQHPDDCKTKKLLVRRHMPGYGLFAGLGLSSNYVFLAAVLGRTLIDLSPNTYFTGNCDSNGLSCAFLPISSCTAADFSDGEICYDRSCYDTARVISIDRETLTDFLPCAPTEFPKDRCNRNGGPPIPASLNEIIPELGPHGEQFFQGEFSRYLTRPNQRLTDYAAEQMKALQLTDQLIAVHVRHGDKQEGIQFPTRAYGVVVRRVIQITGIRTVFIGSDDKSVYDELPKWVDLPNVRYAWLPHDLNPIVFSAQEAGRKGQNTIGLQLMTQTIINAQAQAFVGTRSSNAGQIVFAMQGNDCSRQKIAFDMYGDLFYNSWYCRGDIEHAGREWMCALQPPESGSLIHQWGGAKTQC